MKNLIFVCLLMLSSSVEANDQTAVVEVVPGQIYRGPRLSQKQLTGLAAKGVKTIINLQGGDLNNPHWRKFMQFWEPGEKTSAIIKEKIAATNLGMNFYNFPLSAIDPVTNQEDQWIEQILALMNTPSLFPIYIHCEHGKDRTGLLIALYRIQSQNKTPKAAHKEWVKNGHTSFSQLFTGHLDEYFFEKTQTIIPNL